MTKEELEKEAEEIYLKTDKEFMDCQDEGEIFNLGYLAGAEPREKRIAELEKENIELKELIEKYRQAVDKCLHITFMGGGCEVNTIGQYATLVDGYLTDVEGLAKHKRCK